jgi:hypothetical protein
MSETEDLVDAMYTQNYTAATEIFNDMISQKMNDALEQEKVSVASQIFNGEEPEDDDYDLGDEVDQQDDADLELEDEDIDDGDVEDYLEDEDLEEIDDEVEN